MKPVTQAGSWSMTAGRKASVNVKEGDIIEIQFGTKSVKVQVENVQETVKKEAAEQMYKYL